MEMLMERILERDNLNRAYLQVYRNKGSAGIDKMTVYELKDYLKRNKRVITQEILNETYKPKPFLMVEIPKENGEKRTLGISTVVDRVIQQGTNQILTEIFDKTFSENSFGFRPNRSAIDGIKQAEKYINEGYKYVVDIDLSKYFDTINQDKLMYLLKKEINDSRVLRLISKILKSGVIRNGKLEESRIGVPQGSPLSPILGNIYLNEMDKELESRGHKFVRYADDLQLYVKSKRAGKRVMESITKFLEKELKLKVNVEKSAVRYCTKTKFLGFSFYTKRKNECKIIPHKKSKAKFKNEIRKLLQRNRSQNMDITMHKLNQYLVGWINYYAVSEMSAFMKEMTGWIRRKIRVCIWKQWKKIKTKFRNLQKLGIEKGKAWEYANTRKGLWRISNSPILSRTLTNEYIGKLGFKNPLKLYSNAHIKFL